MARQATATDNCGVSSITSNPPAQYVMGTNIVTWTASDTTANTRTCQQLVIVVPSGSGDCDGDGLTDRNEISQQGTDPRNPDTDGDGYNDGQEVYFGTSPLNPSSRPNIPANLVGWWRFDEGSGTTALDSSGSGHTGTLEGNPLPAWVTGISSNAISFDGVQNGVGVPHRADLSPTNALSVAAWVKGSSKLGGVVVAKWDTNSFTGSYLLVAETQAAFALSIGGEFVWLVGNTVLLDTNQWHHVAGVYDGTQMRLYLDGRLDASLTTNGAVDIVEAPLSIGGSLFGWPFPGPVDDVRLYNRAITEAEILALYRLDSDGDGLLNWWELRFGLNPSDAADAAQDADGDGLSNSQEFRLGTDPAEADTDGDSIRDGNDPNPTVANLTGNGAGLKAEYYNNRDFTDLKVSRIDPVVDFDWGWNSPNPSMDGDTFSIRWTGQVQPRFSETYTFYTVSDDGVRLWVNGRLLIDNWTDHAATLDSGAITLAAGQKYDIRMEFYDNCCAATAKLAWESPSQPLEIIPQTQLYPPPASGTGLRAEYYDNADLTNLKLARVDSSVDFDWGWGTPHSSVDGDTFSVRWSGQIEPRYSERYTFYTVSDDGVRLWVNGQLLIDNWTDHAVTTNAAAIALVAGERYDIRMEFYDNCCHAVAKLLWESPSQSREVVPTSQLYPENASGFKGEYYDNRDFSALRMVRFDRAIDFDWGRGAPVDSMGPDDFAVRWTGVIQPKYSQTYTFYTVSDDGVRLWMDDRLIIDNWTAHEVSTNTATVALVAGQTYKIKLEYFDNIGEAVAKLWWSSSSQPLESVRSYSLARKDTDGDGLADDDEVALYGTDPFKADTDGDGVSDYEERFETFTNPMAADFSGSATVAAIKNGADVSATLGEWQADGSEIFARSRRGAVDYVIYVPSPDVYQLEVEGREDFFGFVHTSLFDLQVSIDGEVIGRKTLEASKTSYGRIRLFTPWLAAGNHTVRIFWDNAANYTALRLKAIRLLSLGGPDQNANGVKDWVESRLQATCTIATSPTTSHVSPAFIEGRGSFLSMMSISANGTSIPPKHGAGPLWYADVPIAPNEDTAITVSFQNGGLIRSHAIRWVAKNLLQAGDMTIRKGDSVLFTAMPEGATAGTVEIEVVGVTNYVTTVDAPVSHQFAEKGTFTVVGRYTDGGQQTGSITVKVLAHTFDGGPASWVGKTRVWDIFGVSDGVVFNADPKLQFSESGALTNQGRRLNILIDQNEPRWVVSRTGPGGPILDAARADGFNLFADWQTYTQTVGTLEDGSRLVETLLVLSPVLPGVTIVAEIIAGGIVFEDGTIRKELTAADFGELGLYRLRFIMPPQAQGAPCYVISATQGAAFVGDF